MYDILERVILKKKLTIPKACKITEHAKCFKLVNSISDCAASKCTDQPTGSVKQISQLVGCRMNTKPRDIFIAEE